MLTSPFLCFLQAPADVEARVDDLLQRCRDAESMDFSRRRRGGLGIVAYNAALNTFCELGWVLLGSEGSEM